MTGNQSLKDRRLIVRSVIDRLRSRFNVSVAEVEVSEKWQRASLGVAVVGESRGQVDRVLEGVASWIRQEHRVAVMHVEQEWW